MAVHRAVMPAHPCPQRTPPALQQRRPHLRWLLLAEQSLPHRRAAPAPARTWAREAAASTALRVLTPAGPSAAVRAAASEAGTAAAAAAAATCAAAPAAAADSAVQEAGSASSGAPSSEAYADLSALADVATEPAAAAAAAAPDQLHRQPRPQQAAPLWRGCCSGGSGGSGCGRCAAACPRCQPE